MGLPLCMTWPGCAAPAFVDLMDLPRSSERLTCLMEAVLAGDHAVVGDLVALGVDVDRRDRGGKTAFDTARDRCSARLMALLSRGSDELHSYNTVKLVVLGDTEAGMCGPSPGVGVGGGGGGVTRCLPTVQQWRAVGGAPGSCAQSVADRDACFCLCVTVSRGRTECMRVWCRRVGVVSWPKLLN